MSGFAETYHLVRQIVEMFIFELGRRFYFINRALTFGVIELQNVNRGEQAVFLKHWLKQRSAFDSEKLGCLLLPLAVRGRYQSAAREKCTCGAFHFYPSVNY